MKLVHIVKYLKKRIYSFIIIYYNYYYYCFEYYLKKIIITIKINYTFNLDNVKRKIIISY